MEFMISGIARVVDVDGGRVLIKPFGGTIEWWVDGMIGCSRVGDVVKFRHSTDGLWLTP
jgi:hypothetical protein